MRGWARKVLLCAVLLLAGWPAGAHAGAGELDPSFSGDGRVTIVPPSDGTFVARSVAVQPDGRLLVAGSSCAPVAGGDGTCLGGGGASFRVARLTPDGGLDPEFGNGGFVTTPIGSRSQAFDLLLLDDGSFVVAGLARSGNRDVVALAKYTPRGAAAAGFGTDGVVTQPVGAGFAAAQALAAGPDGTLLVAGQAVDGAGAARMAVTRFTAGGVLDGGWGSGGVTFAGPAYGYALGLANTAAGPLVAGVGGAGTDATGYRFSLSRLQPGGGVDPAFGAGGSLTYAAGNPQASSFANAVAAAPGGWVAAGAATGPDNQQAMAVLRGDDAGAPAGGFGTDGQALLGAGQGAVANDVLVTPGGRVLVVGQVRTGSGYAFGTARLDAAGTLDPAFGGGSVVVTGFDLPAARATSGALQPDGKLVTAGIGCVGSAAADCTGGTSVLVMARQLADPPATVEPTPTSGPPPAAPAARRTPEVRVSRLAKRVGRRGLARKGVRLRVRTSLRVRARADLTGTRRGATRRLRLAATTMQRRQRSFSLRLKPRRAAIRRVRDGKLRLRVTVWTQAGVRVTRTFTIRLR